MTETRIIYYIEGQETPYVSKINMAPGSVKLQDFKASVKKFHFKFFFQAEDKDFGVVKEEVINDDAVLPYRNDRIIAWLVAPDPDTLSQKSSSIARLDQDVDQRSQNITSAEKTSNLRKNRNKSSGHNRAVPAQWDSCSTLTNSEFDTMSYDSRDDVSRCSTYSELTVSTRSRLKDRRRSYKKKRPKRGSDTISSYSSSVTDSCLSLNIVEVTINMDNYNFLGISLIGQSTEQGDGGIYIGSIMKGGAVAADGRIQPGDLLLEVNDVSFENMTNEDAVKELRAIVHKPGPIKLTVAKCWDDYPDHNYFTIPKNVPVQPIDPAAWANNIPVPGRYPVMTPAYSNAPDTGSERFPNSLPEAERYNIPLSVKSDMAEVVQSLKLPDSGLEIKTRNWLKITIPDAFIGSDLVNWLQQKVEGLNDRRMARKYASSLLKLGYIRHTVNKQTFSEQCYYVIGDYMQSNIPKGLSNLSLGDSSSGKDSGPQNYPLVGTSHTPWCAQAGSRSSHSNQHSLTTPHLMVATRPQGSSDIMGPSVGQPVVSRVDSNGSRAHDAETSSLRSSKRIGLPQRCHSNSSLTLRELATFGRDDSVSGSDRGSAKKSLTKKPFEETQTKSESNSQYLDTAQQVSI